MVSQFLGLLIVPDLIHLNSLICSCNDKSNGINVMLYYSTGWCDPAIQVEVHVCSYDIEVHVCSYDVGFIIILYEPK